MSVLLFSQMHSSILHQHSKMKTLSALIKHNNASAQRRNDFSLLKQKEVKKVKQQLKDASTAQILLEKVI